MPTVREATFELFRAHGMTTIFGNPGSTELPMLADFPDDFTYVLGLQELVVVGMADGYAQASGRPTHVNLHTAPGVGNAVGGIFNAQANKSPLVITAGQQVRPHITIEANLTNRDATEAPQPYVKWAHEPSRAQDVPVALARAIHQASLPPRGPVFVSIPMDDWEQQADEDRAAQAVRRVVSGRVAPDPAELAQLASLLESARNPVLVAGPDIDASGGWDARGRAGREAAPARMGVARDRWQPARLPGGPPELPRHPARRRSAPLSEALKGHDLVLVVGSSVFPYYPYLPGPLLPEGTSLVAITSDPGEAARAPMGDAIVGDVAHRAPGAGRAGRRERPAGAASRARRPATAPDSEPISGSEAMAALADAWPEDGIAVLESPSSTLALRNRLRHLAARAATTSARPAGSGSGSPPAVGVQLAQPIAAGRVRARRGLGPVRDHRAVDRGRLQGPGHVPGAPQRGVHDPQVVRGARAGVRARRASTCRASTPPPSPARTGCRPRDVSDREELTEALRDGDRGGRRAAARTGAGRVSGMWME